MHSLSTLRLSQCAITFGRYDMVHPGDEETRFTGRIPTQERLIKLLCTGKPINALFVC